LPPSAYAAVCPTGATGRWIIKDWTTTPITTWSDARGRRMLGRTVVVTDKLVVFAGKRCPVSKVSVSNEPENPVIAEWEGPPKWPGFDTMVDYECANDVIIPVFEVGPSCRAILASMDGATFRLIRAKPARAHGPR